MGKNNIQTFEKGGTFVLTEFHPFIDLLDPAQYDYFYKKIPDVEIEKGTYTDGGEDIEIKPVGGTIL